MLWTPQNDFGWWLDNWGSAFTPSSMGVSVNAHATNANEKGDPVSVWAGSSVLYDVYEIHLTFHTPGAAAHRFLFDLLVDPAGGTSWSVLVANLAVNSPFFALSGVQYVFPLFIKAGTSIGLQQQCSTANIAVRANVLIKGRPSHPELMKVGHVVQTLGATTASTEGTAFTAGNQVMGSYSSSLGTLTRDSWFWQLGMVINDSTQLAMTYGLDVAAGDATDKIMCGQGWLHLEPGTGETSGKLAIPCSGIPYRRVPKSSNVYVRGWATTAPDSNTSAIVYAVAE